MVTSTMGGNLALTTAAGGPHSGGSTETNAGRRCELNGCRRCQPPGSAQIGGTQTLNALTFVLASDTNLNALPLPSSGNITANLTGTQASFAGAPILPSAVNLSTTRNNSVGL